MDVCGRMGNLQELLNGRRVLARLVKTQTLTNLTTHATMHSELVEGKAMLFSFLE